MPSYFHAKTLLAGLPVTLLAAFNLKRRPRSRHRPCGIMHTVDLPEVCQDESQNFLLGQANKREQEPTWVTCGGLLPGPCNTSNYTLPSIPTVTMKRRPLAAASHLSMETSNP